MHDLLSRPTNLAFGNSTNTALSYAANSQDWSYTQNLASTPQDLTVAFTRNPAAQTLSRNLSNAAYNYAPPSLNQAYVRNGLNQYTSVGGVGFSYSGGDGQRGNLTSDGARSFSYDLENRLLNVTGSPGVTLTYDPLGRLRTSTSNSVTTTLLYAGDQLVAEYNGSTLLRRYAFGAGVDRPITWYEGANLATRNWLHADELGSVIATSDNSGAATIYSYGPYGEPNSWTGSRFRYTGQIALPEVQLYHYKARAYDPRLGRFLQTDPVGYEDNLNLYAYVFNDPLNATDPTGLVRVTCQIDKPESGEPTGSCSVEDDGEDDWTIVVTTTTHQTDDDGNDTTTTTTVQHVYPSWRGIFISLGDTVIGDVARDSGVRFPGFQDGPPPPAVGPGFTGRTQPRNLREQLAMQEARSNPGAGQTVPLRGGMRDSRWPASDGWVKMRQNVNGVEVHYLRNTRTGATADWKFVD